jgi:hypothetical protein
MSTAHPLEIVFLVSAVVSLSATTYLFTLKLSDLLRVKREKINGPILFMVRDNLRRQAFYMAFCAGMVALAVSAVNNRTVPQAQTLNLICGMVAFAILIASDALFTYRRREKLALLVALYEGMRGGRRATDPPAEETV